MKNFLFYILFIFLCSSFGFSQTFNDLVSNYEKAGKSNNYTEQVRILTLILEKYPNEQPEKTYNNRGNAYYALKDYDKAISDYTKAIELKPDYADAYFNRGLCYYMQAKYMESISDYFKFAEFKPDDPGIYDNIGYSYLRLKDYTNATANFKKCIEKDKTIFDAMLGLAITYNTIGEIENAKKYLNDAIKTEPKLSEGMKGIEKLEKDGWSFTDEKKTELKKLFELIGM